MKLIIYIKQTKIFFTIVFGARYVYSKRTSINLKHQICQAYQEEAF